MQINARGLKIYYEQAGSGDPMLLLHGWGSSCEAFRPIFHRAAEQRKVYSIDFPGFGLSEPPPDSWGTEEYAEMVAEILKKWNVESTDIVAHSFGARVAVRMAIASPYLIKRMVLTGAAGLRKSKKPPLATRLLIGIAKAVGSCGAPGEWFKRKIYGRIGSADYLAAGAMRPILVRVVNEDLMPLLPRINHETLLIWGENDTETPVDYGKRMNKALKNSKLETISGAGHYAFSEKPDEFYKIMMSFLEMKK